jgi:hypothetical protein
MRSYRIGLGIASLFVTLLSVFGAAAANAGSVSIVAKGTLTLQLGSIDRFIYGPTGETQAITGGNCSLITGTNLMTVTSSAAPGFSYDSIGVRGSCSNGTPCSRVSVGEPPLVLQLGTSLSGLLVTKASLDIEAKKNAVVKAVAYDSTGATQTFYLLTGTSKTNSAYSYLQGPNVDRSCSCASDSGPDSGARDNCRWNINGQWTKLELSALVGEFGLEGGGDGTGPSTFDLGKPYEGQLGCPIPGSDSNIIPPKTGPNSLVYSGYRLDNVDDIVNDVLVEAPTCENVPYTATATCPTGTGACTDFVYDPLHQGTNMAFYFKWEWPPEPVPTTGGLNGTGGISAVPYTTVSFNGGPARPLDICKNIVPIYEDVNNTPLDPSDDVFTGIDPAFPPPDLEATAGTQSACLISRDVKQNADGTLSITEGAYVQGDVTFRRN